MQPQIELVGVDDEFQRRVESITALQLGSVLVNVQALTINVSRVDACSGEKPSFRCDMLGKLHSGEAMQVTMLGAGVHTCVADAAARMARQIKKQVRGAHVDSRATWPRRTVSGEPLQ